MNPKLNGQFLTDALRATLSLTFFFPIPVATRQQPLLHNVLVLLYSAAPNSSGLSS